MDSIANLYEKLVTRFDINVKSLLVTESKSFKLKENGSVRIAIRKSLHELNSTADVQIDSFHQIKLLLYYSSVFLDFEEFELALDCFENILCKSQNLDDTNSSLRVQVQVIQLVVKSNFQQILASISFQDAPILVSQLLQCLRQLRSSLQLIFQELTISQQEEQSWLILNSVKLIYSIAEPLVWMNCGKYVVETLVFSVLSMESVITLCTTRHLRFRMKLYSTIFSILLSQGTFDQSFLIVQYATQQVQALRDREELDPPLPPEINIPLQESEMDLGVMRVVLSFWKDPDSFSLSDDFLNRAYPPGQTLPIASSSASSSSSSSSPLRLLSKSFRERCISECLRIHQCTTSLPTEASRKRSTHLMRAVCEHLKGLRDLSPPPEHDSSSMTTTASVFDLSPSCLVEICSFSSFESLETSESPPPLSCDDLVSLCWDKVFSALISPTEIVSQSQTVSFALPDPSSSPTSSTTNPHSNESNFFSLIRSLRLILSSSSIEEHLKEIADMTSIAESFLCSSIGYRRQSFLRKYMFSLWSKVIYPQFQLALSNLNPHSASMQLEYLQPFTLLITRSLNAIFLEDPLLSSSLALLSAKILHFLEDHRSAISLLYRSLEAIEESRAVRVDLSLHFPEDIRDVSALQRLSFSSRLEAHDWFHSAKRLGAQAFAGFGIFGAGSKNDRVDQALAELHTDMTALYFRVELEFSLKQRISKLKIKNYYKKQPSSNPSISEQQSSTSKKIANGKSSTSTKKAIAFGSSVTQSLSTQKDSRSKTTSLVDELPSINAPIAAEKLSCVPALRCFCGKNNYSRALLSMEMARLDTSLTPEGKAGGEQIRLLQLAMDSIEEAEARETMLQEAFGDLTLMHDHESKHPVVLARSHRFIYVAPVGSKRYSKASYYRILAKEQGSGTECSITSDSLLGCEVQVPVSNLTTSPSLSCVCIRPLVISDRFVFASVPFTIEDKVAGQISPNTPPVEALNPLPTILLWAYLNQVASSLGHNDIAKIAAQKVCNRFFANPRISIPRTVGKGINLFIDNEPALCMLAIEQSSPAILIQLAKSLLSLETLSKKQTPNTHHRTAKVHWELRRPSQASLITSIRKAAMTAIVSASIHHHELTVKSVALGYDFSCELLGDDEMHVSPYLIHSFMIFATVLQSIPKVHWHEFEHNLYCRVVFHLVRFGILSRNSAPVAEVLNSLHLDSLGLASKDPLIADHSTHYSQLIPTLRSAAGLFDSVAAWDHLRSLFHSTFAFSPGSDLAAVPTSGNKGKDKAPVASVAQAPISPRLEDSQASEFWSLTPTQRYFLLKGKAQLICLAESISTPELQAIENCLRKPPTLFSDFLRVFLQLASELVMNGLGDRIGMLFNRFPIFEDYLAIEVQQMCSPWELKFLHSLSNPPLPLLVTLDGKKEEKAKAAPAPASAPTGKGTSSSIQQPVASPRPAPLEIPPHFADATPQEQEMQIKCLAEICLLVSEHCTHTRFKANHFPRVSEGPQAPVLPDQQYSLDIPVLLPATEAGSASNHVSKTVSSSQPSSPRGLPMDTPRPLPHRVESTHEYLNLLCSSVYLFVESNCPVAANKCAVTLWNSISDQWLSPWEFASAFKSLFENLKLTATQLVKLWESISSTDPSKGAPVFDPEEGVVSPISSPRNLSPPGSPSNLKINSFSSKTYEDYPVLNFPLKFRKEMLLATRELFIFLIKIVWLQSDFPLTVKICAKVLFVLTETAPEFCKNFGDSCIPLMLHSQQQLIDQAQAVLSQRQALLDQHVNNWEELQRRKRKKKVRIARLEKEDDELEFEAERDELKGFVDQAQQRLEVNEQYLANMILRKKNFEILFSAGVQFLDKVRKAARAFVLACRNGELDPRESEATIVNYAEDGTESISETGEDRPPAPLSRTGSLSYCLNTTRGTRIFNEILEQFDHLSHFLRECKDRYTLIEALKEQGDFALLFGRFDEAKRVWNDGIDGLFSVLDACLNWKTFLVPYSSGEGVTSELLAALSPAIVILGNLSKFCSVNDFQAKTNYCRMAAELGRILFSESLGHPVTLSGFSAYVCRELGGFYSLSINSNKLSFLALSSSLDEIISVLKSEGIYLPSLPLIVFLEHVHSNYTRNINSWVQARLRRIEVLLECRFFSEAVSMISSLKPSILSLLDGTFNEPLKPILSSSSLSNSHSPLLSKDFDTSSNALNFYGAPPFWNHLPPHHEKNVLSINYVRSFPDDFKAFADQLRVDLPEWLVPATSQTLPTSSTSPRLDPSSAPKEKLDTKKKGKGKDSTSESQSASSTSTTPSLPEDPSKVPLILPTTSLLISKVCGEFLVSLGGIVDFTGEEKSDLFLKDLLSQATSLSSQAQETLLSLMSKPSMIESPRSNNDESTPSSSPPDSPIPVLSVPDYLVLDIRFQLIKVRSLLHTFQFKSARGVLCGILKTLKHDSLLSFSLSESIRNELSFLWLTTLYHLSRTSIHQARFEDNIRLTSQGLAVAQTVLSPRWLRVFRLERAILYFKIGCLKPCQEDLSQLLKQYEEASWEDTGLPRALVLQATLTRELAISSRSRQAVIKTYVDCILLLRKARRITESLARSFGFFGSDVNFAYERDHSTISSHHFLPPLLHNLTEIHPNDPHLTLKPSVRPKKLLEVRGIVATTRPSSAAQSRSEEKIIRPLFDSVDETQPTGFLEGGQWGLRPALIDSSNDVYCQSEFCNLYLKEVWVLGLCHLSLCQLLDEARGACPGEGNSTLESDSPSTHFSLNSESLLREQRSVAEEGLKILRMTLYHSSLVHSNLLYLVGKARVASNYLPGFKPLPAEDLLLPFQSSLQISHQTSHPWPVMKNSCLELVEFYGNGGSAENEELVNLKMAALYLLTAIRLSNQHQLLMKKPLLITNDKSFSIPPSEELSLILSQCSISSATPSPGPLPNPASTAPSTATTKKGKAVEGSTLAPPGPSGRDALFLLISLLRERDPMWPDGYAFDIGNKMNDVLSKLYPHFLQKCRLASLPSQDSELAVAYDSLSTFWAPLKNHLVRNEDDEIINLEADGSNSPLYSHITGYFLVGPKAPEMTSAPPATASKTAKPPPSAPNAIQSPPLMSGNPFLAKKVIQRSHLVKVEHEMKDCLDTFLAASLETDLVLKVFSTLLASNQFGLCVLQFLYLMDHEYFAAPQVNRIQSLRSSFESEGVLRADFEGFSFVLSRSGSPLTVRPSSPADLDGLSLCISLGADRADVTLSFTQRTLESFSRLVTCQLDLDGVVDPELSRLLRVMLRYEN